MKPLSQVTHTQDPASLKLTSAEYGDLIRIARRFKRRAAWGRIMNTVWREANL